MTKDEIRESKAKWFQKNKVRILATRRPYIRKWQSDHRQRMAVLRRSWYERNQEKVKAARIKWQTNNWDAVVTYRKRWRDENKSHVAQIQRNRLAVYKQAVVDAYGGSCECCGETEVIFLTVEHVRKDGQTHRNVQGNFYRHLMRSGFPKDQGLSILCMNCNWAQRNGAICPHKKAVFQVIGL